MMTVQTTKKILKGSRIACLVIAFALAALAGSFAAWGDFPYAITAIVAAVICILLFQAFKKRLREYEAD